MPRDESNEFRQFRRRKLLHSALDFREAHKPILATHARLGKTPGLGSSLGIFRVRVYVDPAQHRKIFIAETQLEHEPQAFILKTVIERLGIAGDVMKAFSSAQPVDGPLKGEQQNTETGAAGQKPKDFLKNKRPTTDVQRIACLAYFLTNARGTPQFKTRDLTDLNTEAAGDRFANPAQSAKNATNQNRFLSAAGKGRKQITALGEDVVEALPNQELVKAAIAAATAGRRKRRTPRAKNRTK